MPDATGKARLAGSAVPPKLADQDLLCEHALIDGRWVPASSGATFGVRNPADGTLAARVPDMAAEDVRRAIDGAAQAFDTWRHSTARQRADVLRRWHRLILEKSDDLALLLALENGKPLKEARAEIAYGASFLDWFAEEARRVYGDVIPSHRPDARLITLKQPIGVVAAITPWNFPMAMIARKVAPAVAVGCTVVVKPAEQTPLSALALGRLAERAGLPAGVLNIVTGLDAAGIGTELCANPAVRKVTFTGSTEVGRILMRNCADSVKKLSLELGGNAPFIVFGDADIDAALEGAVVCKFRNAGQTCVSANRIYVHRDLYDAFAKGLSERAAALAVGPGLDADTDIGPLIDRQAVERVEMQIRDAVAKGATVITGGGRHPLGGSYFQPTVLSGVGPDMRFAREETFGPAAPIFRFDDEASVVSQANDSEHGLAAYFYTRDLARAWRVAEALEYGMVGINTGAISTEVAPFGGMKQSGLGREGSKYGAEEFTELKYLCLAGL